MSDKKIVTDTMQHMFASSETAIKKVHERKSNTNKQELELALAVLLVDLASCDQSFDPEEYNVIQNSLISLFGTTKQEVQELVNQANLTIANLRGTNKFAELLRDNLSEAEKNSVMQVITDLISADGKEDGFETYLKQKFKTLLGV